ncbi:MAG: pyrimidine 5'-nucleotidase [Burkholderiaceae bacterium]
MARHRVLVAPKVRLVRSRRPQSGNAHSRVWLFDLDNTLHDTSHAIFPYIDRAMTAAVVEFLGVDEAEANRLRRLYWQRYGATVIGMVRHHGVNADDFLARCHDFDTANLVRAEKGLAYKLSRLPGRKVLLTNAPMDYAREVLKHLGILQQFKSIWSIEHMRWHTQYRPKPSPALLRYVLAREGVAAHQATLVEDTLVNLRSARQVGLRTVFVHHPGTPFAAARHARPAYVDLRVNSVSDLLLNRRPLRA